MHDVKNMRHTIIRLEKRMENLNSSDFQDSTGAAFLQTDEGRNIKFAVNNLTREMNVMKHMFSVEKIN